MKDSIVFYQLNARFLERTEDVPENAKQVVYYSLALGHHIGVFDCFRPVLRCSSALYSRIVEALPEGGGARRKLAGLLRFGEITVDSSHTAILRHSFALALPSVDDEASEWLQAFDAALEIIVQEPVVYLMGRRIA